MICCFLRKTACFNFRNFPAEPPDFNYVTLLRTFFVKTVLCMKLMRKSEVHIALKKSLDVLYSIGGKCYQKFKHE